MNKTRILALADSIEANAEYYDQSKLSGEFTDESCGCLVEFCGWLWPESVPDDTVAGGAAIISTALDLPRPVARAIFCGEWHFIDGYRRPTAEEAARALRHLVHTGIWSPVAANQERSA